MKIFKGLTFILLVVFACSCNQDAKHESIGLPMDSTHESFTSFLEKFNRDSTFQKSRTVFPFKVIQTEEEDEGDKTVLVEKDDWTHVDFSFPGDKKNIVTRIDVNNDEVNIRLQVEDTGVYVEHFFQKKQGQWWLVYVRDGST
jgi:hypothetical protein